MHTVGGHFGVGVCGVVEDAAELLVLGGSFHEEELGVVVRQAVSGAELKRKKWEEMGRSGQMKHTRRYIERVSSYMEQRNETSRTSRMRTLHIWLREYFKFTA